MWGSLHSQILLRDKEVDLELVSTERKWSFPGEGDKLRLVSEGERIRLAYLFDPYVTVSSSSPHATISRHCRVSSGDVLGVGSVHRLHHLDAEAGTVSEEHRELGHGG